MSGFSSPNHTQVPNDLFDSLLPLMGEAELKVVLHAIRQTLGYHRGSDAISLSQFMKATGLTRRSVVKGIQAAQKRGLLKEVSRGKRGLIVYQLVIEEKPATSIPSTPVYLVHQSTRYTSSGILSTPEDASTGIPSRHTKERRDKETKEIKRESAPPLISEIQSHPVWKAYCDGYPETKPRIDTRTAAATLNALQILQQNIDAQEYTLADITELVRWKLSAARKITYFITYVDADMPDFKAYRLALHSNGKPHASSSQPVLTAATTSEGAPTLKARGS